MERKSQMKKAEEKKENVNPKDGERNEKERKNERKKEGIEKVIGENNGIKWEMMLIQFFFSFVLFLVF